MAQRMPAESYRSGRATAASASAEDASAGTRAQAVRAAGAVAPPEVLSRMAAGDEVRLKIMGTRLAVENPRGAFLGHVDPKHAQRIQKLMQGGNKYDSAVVSVSPSSISVIYQSVI